jgi:hypothetical protein
LHEGDRIAIWDKKRLLGVSTIEEIVTDVECKVLHRCSKCRMAGIKPRKGLTPRYKCYKCKAEFEVPLTKIAQVKTYQSRHDAGWKNLEGAMTGPELRSLCVAPKSQLSLRPLRWSDFVDRLSARLGPSIVEEADRRAPLASRGGHVMATVRVRVGQRGFRENLLRRQGSICAFSGPAPETVLEAGHLYSYAALGVHDQHGGLLLRRDLHRLFDDGHLAVWAATLTIDVSPSARAFDQYGSLHGQTLRIPISEGQQLWLEKHWAQHRGS